MNSTHTVPTTSTNHQQNATSSTEKVLITALGVVVVVVLPSIGALLWIALSSAEEMGNVAPVVIPVIGGITLAAISAIAVVLRKRPTTRSRR